MMRRPSSCSPTDPAPGGELNREKQDGRVKPVCDQRLRPRRIVSLRAVQAYFFHKCAAPAKGAAVHQLCPIPGHFQGNVEADGLSISAGHGGKRQLFFGQLKSSSSWICSIAALNPPWRITRQCAAWLFRLYRADPDRRVASNPLGKTAPSLMAGAQLRQVAAPRQQSGDKAALTGFLDDPAGVALLW